MRAITCHNHRAALKRWAEADAGSSKQSSRFTGQNSAVDQPHCHSPKESVLLLSLARHHCRFLQVAAERNDLLQPSSARAPLPHEQISCLIFECEVPRRPRQIDPIPDLSRLFTSESAALPHQKARRPLVPSSRPPRLRCFLPREARQLLPTPIDRSTEIW